MIRDDDMRLLRKLEKPELGLGLGFNSGASSYAPETQALLARMDSQPDSYDAQAYNEAIRALKMASIWDKLEAFYLFGAHTQQASQLNWKGSTYDITAGGTVTHIPYFGFTSDGTTGHLETGYSFAPGRQNDGHLSLLVDTETASTATDCGNANSAILARSSTDDKAFFRINGAAASFFAQTANVSTRSHYCVSRTISGSENFYICGELAGAGGVSTTPEATYTIWFCGRNASSPVYSAKRQTIGTIGKGLITAEVTQLEAICVRLAARLQSRPTVGTGMNKLNNLLTFMRSNSYRRKYLFGTLRRAYQWGATTPDIWEDTYTIGGKRPGLMMLEWHHPMMTGSLFVQQRMEIIDHYEAGGIITIHHHAGNPLTGSFYQIPSSPGTLGNQYDTAGGTVAACLIGGSRRTQFLDYCDAWATFLNGLIASDGSKVPIIVRPFHEINGDWFWWNAAGTDGGIKQLYIDFVDRLRAQGVTNALFVFCQATGVDQNYALISARYPGDSYVDILGVSAYDVGVTTGLPIFASYYSGGQAIGKKPLIYSELGFQDVASSDITLWNTKVSATLQNAQRGMASVAVWREPFGYADNGANESDVATMLASTRCLTLDRLSGVYG